MVQIGHFTVNLVSAETEEVFKEHTGPDNSVYAEVEPDIEYFIQVASTRGKVSAKTKVDGVSLGYRDNFGRSGTKYVGNWERTNGESKTTALRFNSAAQASKQESGQANSSMLTGKVEVRFNEKGAQTRVKKNNDIAPKQLSRDVKVGGKKCVLSGVGSHVIKERTKTQRFGHKRGKRLCTITLHYCTAMGLILNKILDAPPSSQPAPLVPAPLVDNEADNEHPRGEKKRHRNERAAAALKRQTCESKRSDSAIDVDDDDDDVIMSALVASNLNERIVLPSLGIKRARRGQKSVKPEKVKPEKKRYASAAGLDEKESKKVAAPIDLTGDDDDGRNERWL